MKYVIKTRKSPDAETINQIRKGLISHNIEHSSIAQGESLALVAHSHKEEFLGGVVAWQWGGCIEIEYFWVKEEARGSNLGTELLSHLETFLHGKSQKSILTNTFSFQALEFYLKNGFVITDEVSGYPDNVKKFFLRKTII